MTNPQYDRDVHMAAIDAASRAVIMLREHWGSVHISVERIDHHGAMCHLDLNLDDDDVEEITV